MSSTTLTFADVAVIVADLMRADSCCLEDDREGFKIWVASAVTRLAASTLMNRNKQQHNNEVK
jgi:hypothetical protein